MNIILLSIIKFFYNLFVSIMEYLDRKRIILDRESQEPYLERYYLFLKDRKDFPFNIFIHKFLKSDSDDLHDHPWDYRTIILCGGYWEYTEKGKAQYKKDKKRLGMAEGTPSLFWAAGGEQYEKKELDPEKPIKTISIHDKEDEKVIFDRVAVNTDENLFKAYINKDDKN